MPFSSPWFESLPPIKIPKAVRQLAILSDNSKDAPRFFLLDIPHLVLFAILKLEFQRIRQHLPQQDSALMDAPCNYDAIRDPRLQIYLDR